MVKFALPSSPFRKRTPPPEEPLPEAFEGDGDEDDSAEPKQSLHEKIAADAAAEAKGEKKEKTDEEEAAEAAKLSKGDNPARNNPCTGCMAFLCRCGRKTKEERQRLKVLKEQHEIEESERKDRQKDLDNMGSEEKLTWDALELPERNCNRLIKLNDVAKKKAVERAREDAKKDAEAKEEGATYHHCQLKEFKRYKASPALHRTFSGHKNHIHGFKISPDYRYIVSASADHTVRMWEVSTGKVMRTFEGHTKAVRDVDIIPGFNLSDENRLIVSASSDKTLRMWDARSDSSKRTLKGHTDVVYSCAFSPDGNNIISSSEDTTIRLWSAHEGHVIFVYKGHTSAIMSARYSPGGRYIVSCSDYGERQIKLWHAKMPVIRKPKRLGQRVFFTKAGLIKNIIFSEDPGEGFFNEPDSDEETEILSMLKQDEVNEENSDDGSDLTEGGESAGAAGSKDSSGSAPSSPSKGSRDAKDKSKNDGDGVDEDDDENGDSASVSTKHKDVLEQDGFSITILSEGRFGKLNEASGYYPGQELIVNVKGVKPFQSFFVAAYLKQSQFDMFDAKSGGRCGYFDRSSVMEQENAWLTCRAGGVYRAATSDTRKKNRTFNNLQFKWTAPTEGVGPITFKSTIVPKHLDDPDIKNIYGLSYSLSETMPPRKRGLDGDFTSSGRNMSFKPKIKLSFDVFFNHNHMLNLFRDKELDLAEHYFTHDASCTLPMGKLGVEKVRGAREIVKLLSESTLGPNQIMKSVKPMTPTERLIESRTIVIKDELPKASVDLAEIEYAMGHEGKESEEEGDSKDEYGEDKSKVDPNKIFQANPNEATTGEKEEGAANVSSQGDDDTVASNLSVEEEEDMKEDEPPERADLRKEYEKLATLEVLMIKQMKKSQLMCAEEVRTIHLPAHKAAEVTDFAVISEDLVQNGFYGGSQVHLQMHLPPNYPHNARPYDLAAQAAKKGKEMMLNAQQNKKKHMKLDARLLTAKGRKGLVDEMVEYMLQLHDKKKDHMAKARRVANPLLPGFEDLHGMRIQAMTPHFVQQVGSWVKGDQKVTKNTQSANVRATINAGKRGEDAANLIAQLASDRKAANAKHLEEMKKLKEEVDAEDEKRQNRKKKKRKSRLTWGKDKTEHIREDIFGVDEEEEDDVKEMSEVAGGGSNKASKKTLVNMFLGRSSMLKRGKTLEEEYEDEIDELEEIVEDNGGENNSEEVKKGKRKTKSKKRMVLKELKSSSSVSSGGWISSSFFSSKKNLNSGSMSRAPSTPVTPKKGVLKRPKSVLKKSSVKVTNPNPVVKVPDIDSLVDGAVEMVGLKPADDKSKEDSRVGGTLTEPLIPGESLVGDLPEKQYGGTLPENKFISTVPKAKLTKKERASLALKGANNYRRNDFDHLPGFELHHFRHDSEHHLINYDNDLLYAEQKGGLIRTFLKQSGKEYDGHAASINEICFSHDERRVGTCSSDKTIKTWDPIDGNMVQTLYGHTDEVMGVNFSHDGLFLVSCSLDNLVIVWNLTNGGILKKLFGHYDAVYRCCFTHNANSLLSSSCDMTIKAWSLTPNVPDPPERPIMSEVTTNRCLMTWKPPPGYNEEITAYFIEYRIGHRGDFGNTLSVSGFDRRRRITGLLPGTAYQFRIRAMNRMGKGAWSIPSPQVITEFGVPQKVERPEVEDIQTTSILIKWFAPVPSVKGSAIQHFHAQLSGYGMEFASGLTWKFTWNEGKDTWKKWCDEKERKQALEEQGKDPDDPKNKKKGLKTELSKMMMALRTKRETRESKSEKSRKSRESKQGDGVMSSIMAELRKEVEEEAKAKLDKDGNPIEDKEAEAEKAEKLEKKLSKMNWMEAKAERKKQFMKREIERTKKHLEDQKARRKRREQIKRSKKEGKKKQQRLEKKYKKSQGLIEKAKEAETKHKKLFAPMAFRATGLKPGIMYRVRVAAINTTGEGPFSEGCYSSFTLSVAPDKGEPPHLLHAELDKLQIEWATPHDNGAAITGFMVRQCWDGAEHEFKRSIQRILIDKLEPGVGYQFQMKSQNSEGWSDWSDRNEPHYTLTKQPDIPEKPKIIGKTPVSISFKVRRPHGNGDDVFSYIVRKREMSVKKKTAWAPAGAFAAKEVEGLEDWENPGNFFKVEKYPFATIEIAGLDAGCYYDFQVACRNKSGLSEFSSSTFRTKTMAAGLPKVPRCWMSNVAATNMVVNWDEPDDMGSKIVGYQIQEWCREMEDGIEDMEVKETYKVGNIMRRKIDALDPNFSYRFRVAAKNGVGLGDFSDFTARVESTKKDPERAAGKGSTSAAMEKALALTATQMDGEDEDDDKGEEEKKNNQLSPGNR